MSTNNRLICALYCLALVHLCRSWAEQESADNELLSLKAAEPTEASESVVEDNEEQLVGYTDWLATHPQDLANSQVDIRFFCQRAGTSSLVQVFPNDANLTAKIDASKPMAFVVHGWMDRIFSVLLYTNHRGWPIAMLDDWVRYADTNACGVDWSVLSNERYVPAALINTHITGHWLAIFMQELAAVGIRYDQMTVAGHSLGAHVAGFAGKNIRQWTGQQLYRIFGLDPAGPLFTFPGHAPPQNLLQPSDASFVQILHTAAFVYGAGLGSGLGDAELVANGGILQPRCVLDTLRGDSFIFLCSHFRSVQYFRFSLNPQLRFEAASCPSARAYGGGLLGLLGMLGMLKQQCPRPITDVLGIYSNQLRGEFQLKTTGTPPFCLGCAARLGGRIG